MKTKLRLAAALAVLLIMSNSSLVCTANDDHLPEATTESHTTDSDGDALLKEPGTVPTEDTFPSSDAPPTQDSSAAGTERNDITAPTTPPMFSARIEHSSQGYDAVGTFTEFLPGTSLVQPLYSLDGEVWQTCKATWNLKWLGSEVPDELKALQNQRCLIHDEEPIVGYLAGQLNRFYLKLQITLENGLTYDTQTAVIDRGDPQPIPEKFTLNADFAPAIRIRQWRPFKSQAQYQITVSANATPEDISALLPDTLPVQVELYEGINFFTGTIADCPVTWKPLALPRLTPGESVTLEDAAEEIIVPAGTLLNTPNGIFELTQPLYIDHDEVRLILNAVGENAEPTGILNGYFAGLELSFGLKPTGATAIRVYTLLDGQSSWVEAPSLLPEEVNAPSLTAGSLFTFVLTKDQEPYCSWLATRNAGGEPTPFLVGLKIEGGVYDGRQLILAYPDTYKIPAQPPALVGSGGNENNAGSDNKGDSTSEGQRPGLPQETHKPEDESNGQEPTPSHTPDDEQETQTPVPTHNPDDESNGQEPAPSHTPDDKQETQTPVPTHNPDDESNGQEPAPSHTPDDKQETQTPVPTQNPDNESNGQEPTPSHNPNGEPNTQEPVPSPGPDDQPNTQGSEPPHNPDDQNAQEPEPPHKPDNQNAQEPKPPHNPDDQPNAQGSEPPHNPGDRQETKTPEPTHNPDGRLNAQGPEPPHNSDDTQEAQDSELPQHPQTLAEETDRHTAVKNDSIEFTVAETVPTLTKDASKPTEAPVVNAEADSPTWGNSSPGTQHRFHSLLIPAAAAVSVGICITVAVGKVTADKSSGKVLHTLYRLFHQKK